MTDYSIGAGGTLNQSDYVDFLKEWYQGTTVADLVYKNHPFLGIVPKNTNVRGNVYPKPIRFANITGQSATYLTAHEQQSPATRERWTCSHTDNYAKATVSNKVMELSMGDPAAFREALTDAVDSAYSAFANDLHFELLARHPKGARAQLPDQTGATLPEIIVGAGEARFFEVGMRVQRSPAAQAALDHSGEIEIVESVDRANDRITLVSDFTSASVITDYLYRAGDFDAKADSLGSWLPGSGVGSAAFNGVDRTADPTRLAGVDGVTGATAPLLTDSLVQTGAALYAQGGSPTHVLLSPADHAKLAFETEQRGRYAKVSSTEGSISFSALEIMTGAGAVPCVAEPAVGSDTYFMIDTGSGMELYSAGGVPRMFNKDGNFYHREETADTLAFYLFGFYGLVVQNPGGNSFVTDAY